MKTIALAVAVLVVSSCSTYTDANRKGFGSLGGGFKDTKIANGIHRITVESGVSPVGKESGVRKHWHRRAHQLCQGPHQMHGLEMNVMDQGYSYMGLELYGAGQTRVFCH